MADTQGFKQVVNDAILDADSLEQFINGSEDETVLTRLSAEYPTLQKAIKELFENGGLPATPFATKALMTASALVDGQYAMVTDDAVNNGLYVKTAGAWIESAYDPLAQAKTYTDAKKYETLDAVYNKIGIVVFEAIPLSKVGISGQLNQNNAEYVVGTDSTRSYLIPVDGVQTVVINKLLTDRFRIAAFTTNPPTNTGNVVFDGASRTTATITTTANTKCLVVMTSATSQDAQLTVKNGAEADKTVIQRIDDVNNKLPRFFKPSPVIDALQTLDVVGAIKDIKFWGLLDSESVYLRTLWNSYTVGDTVTSSIGFNSSLDYHIAPSKAKENRFHIYASWEVTTPETGVKSYLLYKNGDDTTPAIGYVVVDWDAVGSGQQRFVDTTNTTQLISALVKNPALKYLDNKAGGDAPDNPLQGKKIGGLGDSITWGYRGRNDPDGALGEQMQSWLPLAAAKLGMTAANYGISGSPVAVTSSGDADAPMVRRFAALADDLDFICVMGGTNDVRKSVPLGVMSDRVETTYYGALHLICLGLIDKYYLAQGMEVGKTKQIILMTPIKLQTNQDLNTTMPSYVQAVKDVAAYYSLPCLDMYNLSGMTPHVLQTLQGTDTGYTFMYNPYMPDGVHPNQQGQYKMADIVAGFLKTLI